MRFSLQVRIPLPRYSAVGPSIFSTNLALPTAEPRIVRPVPGSTVCLGLTRIQLQNVVEKGGIP